MSNRAAIKQLLLEDGLEDLIPLPEAADSCRREGFIDGDDDISLHGVMQALLELLRAKQVQVWAGPAMEADQELVDEADAEILLRDPEKYRWSSDSDVRRRVYYVNVDNLYVEPGSQ